MSMRSTPRLSRYARLISALLSAALLAWHADAAPAIVLTSTTSVEDSGLLGRILPLFTKATGIEVHVVAQGTGQALETARRGDADLVLVHDPEAEQKFISEGYGIDRRQIAWNDFVIVGPDNDPARIKPDLNTLFCQAIDIMTLLAKFGRPWHSASGGRGALRRRWVAALPAVARSV